MEGTALSKVPVRGFSDGVLAQRDCLSVSLWPRQACVWRKDKVEQVEVGSRSDQFEQLASNLVDSDESWALMLDRFCGVFMFLEPHQRFYGWPEWHLLKVWMRRQRPCSDRGRTAAESAGIFQLHSGSELIKAALSPMIQCAQAAKKDKLFWEGLCFIFRVVFQLNQTGCLSPSASDDLLSTSSAKCYVFATTECFF